MPSLKYLGALPKNWWRGYLATLTTFFSTRSHPLTPLFSTRSHPMTPFLIIHNQFSAISHRMTRFWHVFAIFIFFEMLSKMCLNLCFAPKIGWFVSNSHRLTPFWVFSLNDPFFGEKFLTTAHWMTPFSEKNFSPLLTEWSPFSEKNLSPKDPSYPSTPVASKVECPPGWKINL